MGTKVQSKSYLPGYYSMRDLNEDLNSCSWQLYYGDKTPTNGQYCNSFFSRAVDTYPGYNKDQLKRTMLEHEATFKNQVSELHRLYRIQRDLMDEIKKKELDKHRICFEPSLSSSPLASQVTTEDAHKWHSPSYPVANSLCGRPSSSGVEDSQSPLRSVKGSSIQAGPFLSQNGSNLKDVELLECRPTKVRRKMFDLQLPAERYIDTEEAEQLRDDIASVTSGDIPNGYGKIKCENGGKLFHSDVQKSDCQGDASRSDSCLRGKNSLADLNEPLQIEEINGTADSHFLSCDPYHGGHEAKPKQELLGLPKDISVTSHHQSDNRSMGNLHVENTGTSKGLFSHVLEAGNGKSSSKSISQGFQPQKFSAYSQQVQVLFETAHDSPAFSLNDQSKADLSRERILHGLNVSERNREISNSHPDSVVTSNISTLNPYASSDLVKPWSQSASSWERPSSSLTQKSMSGQTHPFLSTSGPFSQSSVISPCSNGIFGEKWQVSSNSKLNSVGSELSNWNGFYYGSSSRSKEPAIRFPSISYDNLNRCNNSKGVSEHFTAHGSTKPYNCSNSVDMKLATDVNLNAGLSNSSSNEPVLQRGPQIDGGRKQDNFPGLPWLRGKPACIEATSAGRDLNVGELSFSQSSLKQSTNKYDAGNSFTKIFAQNVKSVSFSNNVHASKSEISECLHDKKILGVPIFEKHNVSQNESSFTSPYISVPQQSESEAENKGRKMLLDINLPCDDTVPDMNQDIVAENLAIEKEADAKLSSIRHEIDLNSCVDEDEALFMPSIPSTSMKMTGGLDLEAPVVPEPDDIIHGEELLEKACELPLPSAQSKDDPLIEELIKSAAEAIVAISSSCLHNDMDDVNCNSSETSMIDPLNWFAETIFSFGEDLESKFETLLSGRDGDQDESSLEEIDYFESMILKLAETKEEDYMPQPLVPENLKIEETGTASLLTPRTRKGQGRRGRQRRDFQRDILPGLASLSRHEVTEDLQTFGGLMRATGHSWHSGLTRRNSTRNGCGRGRRRSVMSSSPATTAATPCMPLVQQLNNIEVGLEDRSLTGWGKTTRRPRRQRCPAGNPPALALT